MDEDLQHETLFWNRNECSYYLVFFNKDYSEELTTFQLKESMPNVKENGHPLLAPVTVIPINKQICVKITTFCATTITRYN